MADIIRMPRLSDTMEEGNIVAWLKKVGDKVSPGDILAEVETDKATMELESFYEGYLLYISVEKGPVPVNDVLAVIGDKDEDYKSILSEASNGESKQKQGEDKQDKPDAESQSSDESSTTEKETKKVAIKDTDKETDKKTKKETEKETEEESDRENDKDPEKVESKKSIKDPQPTESKSKVESGNGGSEQRIKSSPLAKSIAAKAGVDLAELKGSGDGGRIIKKDVEEFVSQSHEKSSKSESPATESEEVPLSQMRKTIARRLVESKFSAPHYYLTMKINMDKVAEARKQINDKSDLKISFNDFIVKACAVALRSHPAINSSWLGDKIRVNKNINIGVAVAVDEGLLVPVLFDTDRLGLNEINSTIGTLADKARQKKLQPQEMQGNTFTVSNLGMFGIDEFTAIINPPDSAIMAVGAIADELTMIDGKVTVLKIMKVTLSCDHRVIDGATGSKFLQTFKHLLENPVAMLV